MAVNTAGSGFHPCPLCGCDAARVLFEMTDRLYRTTRRIFRVIECAECRLMRLDPWPAPGELERYYPQAYWFAEGGSAASALAELYRRIVLRDHVRFVSRALESCGEQGLVLDVGCGGGLFLRMMRRRGYRAVGLDFSPGAASTAWRKQEAPVVCASLERAPLAAGCCAAVTMFHVLEHLRDPASYLEAAHALLKPGGRLIVQTPNAACWQFFLLGERWTGLDVPRHLIDFRARDLEALIESAGFEVVRTKHFSLRDNPAGFATSLAPWLDPMVRRVREVPESPAKELAKSLMYLALVAACLPVTLMEAACGAGSTVMMEARKKGR